MSGITAAAIFCPRRFRGEFGVAGIPGVVLFFMLTHEQLLYRIASIFLVTEGQGAMGSSAASRLDIGCYGWEIARDYPQGTGDKGSRAQCGLYAGVLVK